MRIQTKEKTKVVINFCSRGSHSRTVRAFQGSIFVKPVFSPIATGRHREIDGGFWSPTRVTITCHAMTALSSVLTLKPRTVHKRALAIHVKPALHSPFLALQSLLNLSHRMLRT